MSWAIFTSRNLNAVELALSKGEDVSLLVSNKDLSQEAKRYGLDFYKNEDDFSLLRTLESKGVSKILLSSYNRKVSDCVFKEYEGSIFNLHHSLLPRHGGKGMYGLNVLKKTIDSNDEKTGFTIHRVEGDYDVGEVVFQKSFDLRTKEPRELFEEMLSFERKHLPDFFEMIK